MKYIEKTNYQFDLDHLNFEWNHIKDFVLTNDHWCLNKTSLQHSKDCVNQYVNQYIGTLPSGALEKHHSMVWERAGLPGTPGAAQLTQPVDCCLINDIYRGTLFEEIINILNVVSSRIKVIDEHWRGTSVHIDRTKRSHLALNTNPNAHFIFPRNPIEKKETEIIHIPADGYVYKVDTTKPHTLHPARIQAFGIPKEYSRTHLIMCHG